MSTPVFIDTANAAEMLQLSPDAMLDLIRSRKLRTFGGHTSNPFVRRADIQSLVAELGVAPPAETTRKIKSASSRVQTRLTADARWTDVTESDIADWASRADPQRRLAARTAARMALEKLSVVLQVLDEAEAR